MKNLNISTMGHELALSALAFSIGRWATAKALGEINAERKAAQATGDETDTPDDVSKMQASKGIDRFSDFANALNDAQEGDAAVEEQGLDRKPTFVEYCVLFAAINDELVTLANGKSWPRPQTIKGIMDWQVRAHADTVRDSQLPELRAMVEAHSGVKCELTDDELKTLAVQNNAAQAVLRAEAYEANRQEIEDRIGAGIMNYNRFSETSFETLFNNLPARIRYVLLGSIDFKLEDKCNELFTGRLRSGAVSKGANRPMLIRASEITVLRNDQKLVKEARRLLEAQAA